MPRDDVSGKAVAASAATPRAGNGLALPLRGAGVVNTRAAGSSDGLGRLLRRHGAETVVALPGQRLRIAADADAARAVLRAALRGDALVFVSPAAVRYAWQLLPALRLPRRLQICAVGAGTAAALARRGVTPLVQPAGGQDSEGLLAEPALRGIRGQSWAVIGAAGGRDLLLAGLRRRGARAALVEVYQRLPPRWTRLHLARLETAPRPLLVVASSAQSLAALATALPAGLVLALRTAELVVSSLRLAELAREHGFTRIHVAESALAADLAAACARALTRHRL